MASHSGPSGNTPLDGVSLFRNRCLGLGTSVFNGFEGRVRHTLASHWEPSGNTPLDGVSLFRKRCQGLGTIVFLMDSKVGLGTPWRRIGNLPDTRR